MNAITGWVEDKVSGYAKTGLQAGGTLAGNAVGGVGSLVESAGRSTGEGVAGRIGGVGQYINSYGDGLKRSMSADGPASTGAKAASAQSQPKKAVQNTAAGPSKASKGPQQPRAKVGNSVPKASGGSAPKPSTGSAQRAAGTQRQGPNSSTSTSGARKGTAQPATKSIPINSTVKPAGPAIPSARGAKPSPAEAGGKACRSPASQVKNADGKVRVSKESKPRPTAPMGSARATTKESAKKHDAGDPLALGNMFDDAGKGKKK